MRTFRNVLAAGLAVSVIAAVGCDSGPKSEMPKDLNQKLPPPPVGAGSGGAAKTKPAHPSANAD